MMIVFFSSVENGGLAQFSVKLLEEVYKMGYECRCFLPESKHVFIPDELKDLFVFYKKYKVISCNDPKVKVLAGRIMALKPDVIWYCDNAIVSDQICKKIRNVKQLLTIHDVNDHPSYINNIKSRLKDVYLKYSISSALKKADKAILLSKHSKALYERKYKKYSGKAELLNLGAHIPNCEMRKADELNGVSDYYMFFGRIDRYKGLGTLLKAFEQYGSKKHKLVVAGSGGLTDEEKDIVNNNKDIILINRFIEDEEMIYLFKNARALFLPYIEASQSGIIPIAYYYGLPVVVSSVEGLTQFVDEDRTGVICRTGKNYSDAMDLFDDDGILNKFSENCKKYYSDHLDWEKNLKTLFEGI